MATYSKRKSAASNTFRVFRDNEEEESGGFLRRLRSSPSIVKLRRGFTRSATESIEIRKPESGGPLGEKPGLGHHDKPGHQSDSISNLSKDVLSEKNVSPMNGTRSELSASSETRASNQVKHSSCIMESWYPSINERAEPLLADTGTGEHPVDRSDKENVHKNRVTQHSETSLSRQELKTKQNSDALNAARAAEADKAALQSSYRKRYARGLRLLSFRRDTAMFGTETDDLEPMLTPLEQSAMRRKVTAAERRVSRALTGYEVPAGSPIFDQMNVEPVSSPERDELDTEIETAKPTAIAEISPSQIVSRLLPENLEDFPLAELRAQLNLDSLDTDPGMPEAPSKGSPPSAGRLDPHGSPGLRRKTAFCNTDVPPVASGRVVKVSGPISLRAIKKLADQAIANHLKETGEQTSSARHDYEDCVEPLSAVSTPERRSTVRVVEATGSPAAKVNGSLRRKPGAGDLHRDLETSKAKAEQGLGMTDPPPVKITASSPQRQDNVTPQKPTLRERMTPRKIRTRVSGGGYSKLISSPNTPQIPSSSPFDATPHHSPSHSGDTPGYMAHTTASRLAARKRTSTPRTGAVARKPSTSSVTPSVGVRRAATQTDELQMGSGPVVMKPRFRI